MKWFFGMSFKRHITAFALAGIMLTVFAFNAAAQDTDSENLVLSIHEITRILEDTKQKLFDPEDGVEALIAQAVSLIQSGTAWENQARHLFREATRKTDEIIEMISPFVEDERASVRALSCWWLGNVKVFRTVATLRIQEVAGGDVAGRPMREVMRDLQEGLTHYLCAIQAFTTEESYAAFGEQESELYADTVRKNFIAINNTQGGMGESNRSQPIKVTEQAEVEILEEILGDVQKGPEGERKIELIVPPQEGPPQEGYQPGPAQGQ